MTERSGTMLIVLFSNSAHLCCVASMIIHVVGSIVAWALNWKSMVSRAFAVFICQPERTQRFVWQCLCNPDSNDSCGSLRFGAHLNETVAATFPPCYLIFCGFSRASTAWVSTSSNQHCAKVTWTMEPERRECEITHKVNVRWFLSIFVQSLHQSCTLRIGWKKEVCVNSRNDQHSHGCTVSHPVFKWNGRRRTLGEQGMNSGFQDSGSSWNEFISESINYADKMFYTEG